MRLHARYLEHSLTYGISFAASTCVPYFLTLPSTSCATCAWNSRARFTIWVLFEYRQWRHGGELCAYLDEIALIKSAVAATPFEQLEEERVVGRNFEV